MTTKLLSPPTRTQVLQLRAIEQAIRHYRFRTGQVTGYDSGSKLCLPDGDCEGVMTIRAAHMVALIGGPFPEELAGMPMVGKLVPYMMMLNPSLSAAQAERMTKRIVGANDHQRPGLARHLALKLLWFGREEFRRGELVENQVWAKLPGAATRNLSRKTESQAVPA